MAVKNKDPADSKDDKMHIDMWRLHCGEEFRMMHEKLDKLEHGWQSNRFDIGKLDAVISNGLTKKVDVIERRMWAVAGTTIVTLGGVIIQLVFFVLK